MEWDDFKVAWDKAFEQYRTEDPENHSVRVLHDVMGQYVEHSLAGLRTGLKDIMAHIGPRIGADGTTVVDTAPGPKLVADTNTKLADSEEGAQH